MPPSSPQFTPGQVLAAGRRAEAEGKPDLAEHFFRHVVEHYGATTEAAGAREGLSRLESKRGGHPLAVAIAATAQAAGDGASDGTGAPAPSVNGSKGETERRAEAGRGNSGSGDEAAADPGRPAILVPEPLLMAAVHASPGRGRYRAGRMTSRAVAAVGWLMLIVGLVLVPLAWASKTADWLPFAASPAGLAETAKWAAVQCFGGLILVLLAQVARAIFDMADDGGGAGPKD